MKLIWNTLVRALRFKHTKNYVNRGLLTKYPCGETYSYLINLDGYKILFMGSAGLDHQRLREWAKLEVDCLLVPVQGNSKICEIAAEITEILKPKIVIPQHFDDFYPPISQFVDISSFKERIKNSLPLTTVNELQVSKRYLISRQGLRLTNDRDYLKDAVAAG